MYIKNSIGPRTVPWGTPERTGWGEDSDPSVDQDMQHTFTRARLGSSSNEKEMHKAVVKLPDRIAIFFYKTRPNRQTNPKTNPTKLILITALPA